MAQKQAKPCFMARLRGDTSGNVLAIAAAALIPLAGLIGGGVDMSRLYLVKTRLQQACDAGALAGRKAMAAGSWTTGGPTTTEGRAQEFFNANFVDGSYGSEGLTYTFIENEGEVRGTAYVTVPMTMMRIFNMQERLMEVECTAKMEIPNTDVMFVLDITFSMNSDGKMAGMKNAVQCFYEALLRVNTHEVCTANDPSATAYNGTAQIRLGFVPYGTNVNVGRLLHNDWMANNWSYQSREPITTSVNTWEETGPPTINTSFSNWAAQTALGTSFTRNTGYGTFSIVPTSPANIPMADATRPRVNTAGTSTTACTNLNTFGTNKELVGIAETYGAESAISYPDSSATAPTHPAQTQALQAVKTRTATVTTGYRYRRFSSGGTTACYLESATKSGTSSARAYTQQQTATASRPITWTPYDQFVRWRYVQRSFDVSALKLGNSDWAGTLALPRVNTTSVTKKLSGSNSNTTFNIPSDATATWQGCIEERQTVKISNTDPATSDWQPIPAGALDMNIDMVPNDGTPGSHWGPLLMDATWARYTGSGNNKTRQTNAVETATNLTREIETRTCGPTNYARKLKEYRTDAHVTDFESYINALAPVDYGTYHDSGMLWGARLLSPTGLFASENRESASGGNIQRHLIFMTDGSATAFDDNYGLHGIAFYDQRQTTYPVRTQQEIARLPKLTNARMLAICDTVKNQNIRLWVISYGGDIDETNGLRLSQCASADSFFTAANGPALRSRFQQIAAEIADLRLTR